MNKLTSYKIFSFDKKEKWLAFLLASLFFLFPTFLSASNLPLALIVITWAITLKNKNYIEIIRSNKVIWVLGCLYLLVAIGSVYTPANSHWMLAHFRKYATLLFSIVLILILTNRDDLQKVAMNAFIVGMVIILISTWLNIWFLLPWSKSQNLGWGKTHHVVGDHITQSIMMAFFTIIALHRAIKEKRRAYKAIWAVILLLAMVSITHLSTGRTGILMLVVGIISYLVVTLRGKQLAISMIAAFVVIGAVVGSSSMIKSRISLAATEVQPENFNPISSIGHRLYNIKTTYQLILEKPFFGHGTAAYHTEVCRFIRGKNTCHPYNEHPHNQFLLFGADHGLVGIILYALLILSLYCVALRSKNINARAWLCVLTSMLIFNSLINSALYSSRHSQFFGYMIALLVSMCISRPPEEAERLSIKQ